MDKKIQFIQQWNETQKNKIKKLEDAGLNISVETSIYGHIDYLLQQIEDVDQSKFNILAARDNERNLKEQAHRTIERLREQIEIKNKALKWYAAIENYEIGNFTVDQNGELDEWESRVQQDAGEKARTALKGEDTP
ncbi:hypothetical protein [Paenibacillus polymyxa]|uniref:hypothetical protein n=1 Tax=Paenibacillus polymyxa TaxID=1406 RepID=UPI00129AB7E1|nr:hypothetical protein [Paenibacillus polymyxa]KAE8560215.1 hypothetical protein BJH92_10055 [Paenibacillus polymyxa]MCJ1221252.1 hypothetical protein [Paenibacillus polymyxa]